VLLRASQLDVRRGRREGVVSDVSLELRAGEVVALLGPNGAGKSTLLDALSGAIAPSGGSVERFGRVAVALQSPDLARRSVLANVELALGWWGVARGPSRVARARAALELMGVAGLGDRPALSLSGGERRRVHLARALAVEPDILLLDEPFAGLDGEARSRLLEDATSVLRSVRRATLVVVHDRGDAWALADRILVMIGGRLAAARAPAELLAAPPSPVVARFLGYDGFVREGDSTVLTRPAQVRLDDAGPLRATVARVVPLEDGARIELRVDGGGLLYAVCGWPAPTVGSVVTARIEGGVRFASADCEAVLGGPGGG
jgi:ABC-type sulfate/molybdate transport systems ATPase subunit